MIDDLIQELNLLERINNKQEHRTTQEGREALQMMIDEITNHYFKGDNKLFTQVFYQYHCDNLLKLEYNQIKRNIEQYIK